MTEIFSQPMKKTECKKLASWWNVHDKENLYFVQKFGHLARVIKQTNKKLNK